MKVWINHGLIVLIIFYSHDVVANDLRVCQDEGLSLKDRVGVLESDLGMAQVNLSVCGRNISTHMGRLLTCQDQLSNFNETLTILLQELSNSNESFGECEKSRIQTQDHVSLVQGELTNVSDFLSGNFNFESVLSKILLNV